MWERQLLPRWGIDEFEEDCRRIVAAWKDGAGLKPKVRKFQLEQAAYDLIGFMLDEGLHDLWGARGSLLDRRGAKGWGNLFARGLRIIFAYERGVLPFRQRELISLRLMYAYRHYVPSAFLRSFLGGVTQRPNLDDTEPGFEFWIAFRIRQINNDGWRGEYPREISELSDSLPPGLELNNITQPESVVDELQAFTFLREIDASRDKNGQMKLE